MKPKQPRLALNEPKLYCLDANVLIECWNESHRYETFPRLYVEMERKLPSRIILIRPIFDQIELDPESEEKNGDKKKLSLRSWLEENMKLEPSPVPDRVEEEALSLMNKYETNQKKKGADAVDIKLIAYAKIEGHTVVTMESVQKDKPKEKRNYQIPLICELEDVKCINTYDFWEECGIEV